MGDTWVTREVLVLKNCPSDVQDLDTLRERWKHPYTDPELLDEIREAFRAENPDAGVSANERVFKEYAENADALADRQMMSEDYSTGESSLPYKARTGEDKFALDENNKEPKLDVNILGFLEDGKKAGKNALIPDEDGNAIWGRLPKSNELKEKGYDESLLILQMGGKNGGFSHIVKKHGQWIMDAMGIDDPILACKRFIASVLEKTKKIQQNSDDSLIIKDGPAERYFIVAIGKDSILPNYGGIKTAFVAYRPGRFESDPVLVEAEGALELRIPMSSFGENQRLSETSEQESRSSNYPDTATPTTSGISLHLTEDVVKTEKTIPYRNPKNVQDTVTEHIDYSVAGVKAAGIEDARKRGVTYVDPADGKEKFVIPLRDKDGTLLARLNTNFTNGQLYSIPLGGHRDVSLESLLHYDELYKNYPELRKMRVRLYNPTEDEQRLGYSMPAWNGEAAYIGINVRNQKAYFPDMDARNADVLNTLLHETQHAVQHYEGMARGANTAWSKKKNPRLLARARAKTLWRCFLVGARTGG